MEEKRYPILEEEEGVGMVSEPVVGYTATGSGYANTIVDDEESEDILNNAPLGTLGFYTDDPKEFEARMAEIEADLDEVEAGYEDPEKWVTAEQMNANLRKRFPWLR